MAKRFARAFRLAIVAGFVVASVVVTVAAQVTGTERDAGLVAFRSRVDAYAALHRRLEEPIAPLTPSSDPLRNYVSRQLLGNAIRRARAGAQQGDLFNPQIALVFRAIIAKTFEGRDVEALLADLGEDPPGLHGARPVVNEPLPAGAIHEVPCLLLQVLPALPEDLEYRIVGHDLVLWDIHANLVVDVLPQAFVALDANQFGDPHTVGRSVGFFACREKFPIRCPRSREIRRNLTLTTRHPRCSVAFHTCSHLGHTCRKPRFSLSTMKR